MNKKIETKELVKFIKDIPLKHGYEHSGHWWAIIERLELHDVYKEGIERLLKNCREWIEEASR